MKFKSEVQLEALNNATVDTDQFLVSDSSTVKYRTGAQLLSDLGIAGIYVPYTGATGNVDLGTHTLSSYNLIVNHTSGSGVAASITKGGNGEALTINKTSGSGNAMSVTGGLTSLVDLSLSSIANATIDTDRFIVSDGGTIKYRTGAEVLSDIGGQSALTNPITGTGTTNYVSKFTSATTLGNSQLFDNGTNVGIGTTTPTQKLEVFGNIKLADGGQWNIIGALNQSLGIYASPNNLGEGIIFSTDNGTTAEMFIQDGGNVGIGTTTPGAKLEVNGNIKYNGDIFPTTAGRASILNETPTSTNPNIVPSNSSLATGLGGDNGNLALIINSTPAVYVNSSGNVGIGTTSPTQTLEVKGVDSSVVQAIFQATVGTGVAYNGGIQLGNGTGNQNSKIYHNSSGDNTLTFVSSYSSGTGNKFVFAPGGTERVRFQQNGNVGIGTSSPVARLDLYSSNGTIAFKTYTSTTNYTEHTYSKEAGFFIDSYQSVAGSPYTKTTDLIANADAGANSQLRLFTATNGGNPAERMRITAAGNVGIGTTSPSALLNVVGTADISGLFETNNAGSAASLIVKNGNGTTSALYSYVRFINNNTNQQDWRIGTYSNNDFTFHNAKAATSPMVITTSGNVGIGTTSPATNLHVSGDANGILSIGRFENRNVGTAVQSRIQLVAGTATSSIQMFGSGHSTTPRLFRIGGSSDGGDMYLATGGVDRLAITLAGNVGIGTTSPNSTLSVGSSDAGAVITSGGGNTHLSLKAMGSAGELIFGAGGVSNGTAGTERMRITASGNVGIGTTSPLATLHTAGSFLAISGDTFIEVTGTVVNAGSSGDSQMLLESGVASFGISPAGDFRGVRADVDNGVWFHNESGRQFGLSREKNELFAKGDIIQNAQGPGNATTIVKWIKIYNQDDSSVYFMPLYQ